MLDKLSAAATADLTADQVKVGMAYSWRVGLALFVAYAFGIFTPIGLAGFARAGDVASQMQDVKASVTGLSSKFDRAQNVQLAADLTAESKRLDQEIFSIEARLAEIGRLGQQADAIYAQRLSELKSQRKETERRLNAFLAAHPELVVKDSS